jgi:hypothetical protein
VENFLEISDSLHERVQAFAQSAVDGGSAETFEALALDIARFQAQAAPGFRRLLEARGGHLSALSDIPAVPADAFRLTRVACHTPELDRVRFFTSGTTGAERGTHAMRRTDTYEQLSLHFGKQALLAPGARAVVVALATPLTTPPSSSLGYMMARFMEQLDGAPLGDGVEASFDVATSGRWLLSERGVNYSGLSKAIRSAQSRGLPLLLLGTAFALVSFVDGVLEGRKRLPPGSVVMQTGGFKGRTREISMEELRSHLSRILDVPPQRVVGEYGMTELTSQLYEGTIVESELGRAYPGASPGIYFEPPWLRVIPVDPVSLEPVAAGEVGLASFVDLGNVDSAVRVVTQDLVKRTGGGIALLGRQRGAPPRGCSLAVEALLGG